MGNDELTDAAKAEIAEAIRIVREDRFEKFARERFDKWESKTPEPPQDPPKNPTPEPGPTPPPPTPNPTDPPQDPPAKKRGLYWGDSEDE